MTFFVSIDTVYPSDAATEAEAIEEARGKFAEYLISDRGCVPADQALIWQVEEEE